MTKKGKPEAQEHLATINELIAQGKIDDAIFYFSRLPKGTFDPETDSHLMDMLHLTGSTEKGVSGDMRKNIEQINEEVLSVARSLLAEGRTEEAVSMYNQLSGEFREKAKERTPRELLEAAPVNSEENPAKKVKKRDANLEAIVGEQFPRERFPLFWDMLDNFRNELEEIYGLAFTCEADRQQRGWKAKLSPRNIYAAISGKRHDHPEQIDVPLDKGEAQDKAREKEKDQHFLRSRTFSEFLKFHEQVMASTIFRYLDETTDPVTAEKIRKIMRENRSREAKIDRFMLPCCIQPYDVEGRSQEFYAMTVLLPKDCGDPESNYHAIQHFVKVSVSQRDRDREVNIANIADKLDVPVLIPVAHGNSNMIVYEFNDQPFFKVFMQTVDSTEDDDKETREKKYKQRLELTRSFLYTVMKFNERMTDTYRFAIANPQYDQAFPSGHGKKPITPDEIQELRNLEVLDWRKEMAKKVFDELNPGSGEIVRKKKLSKRQQKRYFDACELYSTLEQIVIPSLEDESDHVVLHGDAHMGNAAIKDDQIMLIDEELAKVGNQTYDLWCAMARSGVTGLRQAKEDKLYGTKDSSQVPEGSGPLSDEERLLNYIFVYKFKDLVFEEDRQIWDLRESVLSGLRGMLPDDEKKRGKQWYAQSGLRMSSIDQANLLDEKISHLQTATQYIAELRRIAAEPAHESRHLALIELGELERFKNQYYRTGLLRSLQTSVMFAKKHWESEKKKELYHKQARKFFWGANEYAKHLDSSKPLRAVLDEIVTLGRELGFRQDEELAGFALAVWKGADKKNGKHDNVWDMLPEMNDRQADVVSSRIINQRKMIRGIVEYIGLHPTGDSEEIVIPVPEINYDELTRQLFFEKEQGSADVGVSGSRKADAAEISCLETILTRAGSLSRYTHIDSALYQYAKSERTLDICAFEKFEEAVKERTRNDTVDFYSEYTSRLPENPRTRKPRWYAGLGKGVNRMLKAMGISMLAFAGVVSYVLVDNLVCDKGEADTEETVDPATAREIEQTKADVMETRMNDAIEFMTNLDALRWSDDDMTRERMMLYDASAGNSIQEDFDIEDQEVKEAMGWKEGDPEPGPRLLPLNFEQKYDKINQLAYKHKVNKGLVRAMILAAEYQHQKGVRIQWRKSGLEEAMTEDCQTLTGFANPALLGIRSPNHLCGADQDQILQGLELAVQRLKEAEEVYGITEEGLLHAHNAPAKQHGRRCDMFVNTPKDEQECNNYWIDRKLKVMTPEEIEERERLLKRRAKGEDVVIPEREGCDLCIIDPADQEFVEMTMAFYSFIEYTKQEGLEDSIEKHLQEVKAKKIKERVMKERKEQVHGFMDRLPEYQRSKDPMTRARMNLFETTSRESLDELMKNCEACKTFGFEEGDFKMLRRLLKDNKRFREYTLDNHSPITVYGFMHEVDHQYLMAMVLASQFMQEHDKKEGSDRFEPYNTVIKFKDINKMGFLIPESLSGARPNPVEKIVEAAAERLREATLIYPDNIEEALLHAFGYDTSRYLRSCEDEDKEKVECKPYWLDRYSTHTTPHEVERWLKMENTEDYVPKTAVCDACVIDEQAETLVEMTMAFYEWLEEGSKRLDQKERAAMTKERVIEERKEQAEKYLKKLPELRGSKEEIVKVRMRLFDESAPECKKVTTGDIALPYVKETHICEIAEAFPVDPNLLRAMILATQYQHDRGLRHIWYGEKVCDLPIGIIDPWELGFVSSEMMCGTKQSQIEQALLVATKRLVEGMDKYPESIEEALMFAYHERTLDDGRTCEHVEPGPYVDVKIEPCHDFWIDRNFNPDNRDPDDYSPFDGDLSPTIESSTPEGFYAAQFAGKRPSSKESAEGYQDYIDNARERTFDLDFMLSLNLPPEEDIHLTEEGIQELCKNHGFDPDLSERVQEYWNLKRSPDEEKRKEAQEMYAGLSDDLNVFFDEKVRRINKKIDDEGLDEWAPVEDHKPGYKMAAGNYVTIRDRTAEKKLRDCPFCRIFPEVREYVEMTLAFYEIIKEKKL